MGDDGTFHRTPWVDIEIPHIAVKAAGCEFQDFIHLADKYSTIQYAASFLRNKGTCLAARCRQEHDRKNKHGHGNQQADHGQDRYPGQGK
jgi:hypothetical protein